MEFFYHNDDLREDITALLQRTQDTKRLAQKFSIGKGSADDLISLARTIELTQSIQTRLSSAASRIPSVKKLLVRLDIPTTIAQAIIDSIDEEGLILQQKIQESETAELVAMAEANVNAENQAIVPLVTVQRREIITKETDTSGYFEAKSGIFRPDPWLMLRR